MTRYSKTKGHILIYFVVDIHGYQSTDPDIMLRLFNIWNVYKKYHNLIITTKADCP